MSAGIVPPQRALTIRHGARPGTTRVRSLSADNLHLGFIGNIAPHKGVLTLLDAFRGAPSGWRLSIAGDGVLSELVEKAQSDPRIAYLGYLKGARKDAFYDALDLLVIPSEWEEAATLVAVEAAVRGLPAVVSDRGGLPETPEARIFPARDAEALLRAVNWFLAPSKRLEDASVRLLAHQDRFLWSNHVESVERVLEGVALR